MRRMERNRKKECEKVRKKIDKARLRESKMERPKQHDCVKERIRILNLFPLLFFSSLHPSHRPRAYSDVVASRECRQTTVPLIADICLIPKALNNLKVFIESTACQILTLHAELTFSVSNGLELKRHTVYLAVL